MTTVLPETSPDFVAPPRTRISTGNREIDRILGGGFPADSINIVMGHPGTGKSILAEALAFHNADADRPVLYLTTLSEPLDKIVRYLQQFTFYDEAKFGSAVAYDDLGAELSAQGVPALLERIQRAIKESSPGIIVIDSFKALHDLGSPLPELRRLLHELTGLLTASDTTAFLLGEYTDDHARQYPEFAIADGILQLKRDELTTKDERFLRVLKLRGSSYLEGLHAFRIEPDGLRVFPRLVSPQAAVDYVRQRGRVGTGVHGLDVMFGGGLLEGSGTLVAGPTGAGKTTIALQFALEGVRAAENVLYVNFQEDPTQLLSMVHALSETIDDTAWPPSFHVLHTSPVELQIDSVIVTMFRMLEERNIRRVVIDAMGDLATAANDPKRLHDYLYALRQHLTVRGITSMLTYESAQPAMTGVIDDGGRFSYMSDNILALGLTADEKVRRRIAVLKARRSAHDMSVHDFEITATGGRVV